MSWLSRFLPQRTLDAIPVEGAHVDVEVVVVSKDSLTSPIAPTSAAAIQWTMLESHASQSRNRSMMFYVLATGWRGAPLLVRCGTKTMEIPLDGVRLHSRFLDPNDAVPIQGPAAVVYGDAMARLTESARGLLHLREIPIAQGQELRVKAFVLPLRSSGGDYRTASVQANADLRAVRAVHLYD